MMKQKTVIDSWYFEEENKWNETNKVTVFLRKRIADISIERGFYKGLKRRSDMALSQKWIEDVLVAAES